jgi:short-subunit dehydrogenase
LGEATARKLIKKHNCTLINISRTGIDSLRKSLSEEQNKNVHHFECDISNEQKLAETLVEIRRKFRIPDLIINNAAINGMNYIFESENNENLKKVLNTNVMAHIQLSKFFMFEYLSRFGMKPKFNEETFGVPDPQRSSSIRLRRRKLTIAFITSIVSETSILRFSSYSMSKSLIQSFVDNLRMEIAHFNLGNMINIVSVLPGAFNSSMFHFFKSYLIVPFSTVDKTSDAVIRSIMALKERAYFPFYLRLLPKVADLMIPEAISDKIFLHINRKCTENVLNKVIKEKEE